MRQTLPGVFGCHQIRALHLIIKNVVTSNHFLFVMQTNALIVFSGEFKASERQGFFKYLSTCRPWILILMNGKCSFTFSTSRTTCSSNHSCLYRCNNRANLIHQVKLPFTPRCNCEYCSDLLMQYLGLQTGNVIVTVCSKRK